MHTRNITIGEAGTEPLPMIVIPDVHGHLDQLVRLIKKLNQLQLLDGRRLAFLGDYVDRGPESRATLEFICSLVELGHIAIAGNHDLVLLKILQSDAGDWEYWVNRWARNYEDGVLMSYGIRKTPRGREGYQEVALELAQRMPTWHKRCLQNLPWFYESNELVLVHAGLNSSSTWQSQRSLLQQQEWGSIGPEQVFSAAHATDTTNIHPSIRLVTGHAVLPRPVVRPNRVMLNCGVEHGGPLIAWVSDTEEVICIL
ncbi:hypothetical protein CO173_03030 [Candidatus Uhrbacteria bacterium CG_4_9_14_3_um_filter_41_35]|uniref:Calcineurin-like phosphoesterase domain-containing protein n=1 Tax=Candidatus Uhrbacteria bacterium CG_4_9_14_3_um_filter_41_35 TaxID=1975034 RepID=A0A2M7XFT8_9BACT|nr:MAG: hypothetical protein CO173_03030 [Candidatus Uhrbacteria bacterium CG_4_9_14_3_um_filter_41_35]